MADLTVQSNSDLNRLAEIVSNYYVVVFILTKIKSFIILVLYNL